MRVATLSSSGRSWRDEQDGEAARRLQRRAAARRICRCTTTSSAVVGSSRTSRRGSSASARRWPTRWRMPPESWCGQASTASGATPTSASSSRARAAPRRGRCCRAPPACRRICSPTVSTGLSALMALWKTMEASRQRQRRSPLAVERADVGAGDAQSRRATSASAGRRRRSAWPMVDLPLPDSPARPKISPSTMSKLTWSTAGRLAAGMAHRTDRAPSTSDLRRQRRSLAHARHLRRRARATAQARIADLVEREVDEREREADQRHAQRRSARRSTRRRSAAPSRCSPSRGWCPR